MKDISIKTATDVIKEWGVDCDNYVAHNYRQYLHGGNPYDNSQECADYFLECLKIVCNLGIKLQTQSIQKEAWVAIRLNKSNGQEWLDCESTGYNKESTVKKTDFCNKQIPQWATDNPVVRIVEVIIREKTNDE